MWSVSAWNRNTQTMDLIVRLSIQHDFKVYVALFAYYSSLC